MVKDEFESATNEGSEQKSSSVDNADLEPEQFRKLFIGGLAAATDENSLREFYEKWGTVIDVVVMRDPQTKRSRGFGFVSYANQKEVDESMNNRPHVVDGKTVDPKRAVPREQSSRNEPNVSSKRLYVSGVREDHNEDIFTDYFGTYGKVEKCEVIMDKNTGKPRGFAFITFDDHDSVDKCVLIKSHMITGHRCDVKKALSKDDMNRAQGDRDRGGRFDRGGRGGRMGPGGPGRDAWGGARGGYGGGPQGGGSGYGGGGYGGGWGGSQQGGWGGQQGGGWGGQGGGWGGQQQGGGGWGGQQGGGYGGSYGGGYGGGQQGGWGQGAQQGGGYGGGQQQGGWGGQQQPQGGGQGQGGWGRGY